MHVHSVDTVIWTSFKKIFKVPFPCHFRAPVHFLYIENTSDACRKCLKKSADSPEVSGGFRYAIYFIKISNAVCMLHLILF